MLQIRRRLLFLLLAICLAAVGYLAVHGYLVVVRAPLVSAEAAKQEAETLLFVGIVACGMVLLVSAAVLLRSLSVSRELDKLISLARTGSSSFEESLRRLGPLGGRIRLLHRHLQELSERRSLRISSLSSILEFLLGNTDMESLVLDLTGRVESASRAYLERTAEAAGNPKGRHITELDAEVVFPEVMATMEREHAPVGTPGNDHLVYYPVYDRTGQLANVIAVRGKTSLNLVAAAGVEQRPKAYSRVRNMLRLLAQRRSRGKANEKPSLPPAGSHASPGSGGQGSS